MARSFGSGSNWVSGVIVWQLGPVTYPVNVSKGQRWKRHVDHLKELMPDRDLSDFDLDIPQPLLQTTFCPRSQLTRLPMVTQVSPNLLTHPLVLVQASHSTAGASTESTATNSQTHPPRYPSRKHQPPSRFGDIQTW